MTVTTFVYSGTAQNWVVPIGVTSITMELWGGQGGNQPGGGGTPGKGGYLKQTIAVTPGHTLQIFCGGKGPQGSQATGQVGNAFYGGGYGGTSTTSTMYQGSGGGGESAVTDTTTSTTLCVCGGGGAAGWAGGGYGGNGGGTTGQAGQYAASGKGGTPTAGGAAGTGTANVAFEPATAGGVSSGGSGSVYSGGGGGAGYYGGGGGGSDGSRAYGGGGGSSASGSGATGVVHTQGGNTSSNGKVVFTYNLPPNAPTPQSPINQQAVDITQPVLLQWLNSFNETGDSSTAFDIQYRIKGASTWTAIAKQTSTAIQYSVAANTFVTGNVYEWQIRSYGLKSGTAGAWSASAYFSATSPPPAPTLVHPAASEIINQTNYIVTWTQVVGQQSFHLIIYGDDGTGAKDLTNVIFDSGLVSGTNGGANTWPVVFKGGDYALHVVLSVSVGGLTGPATDFYVTAAIEGPQIPLIFASALPAQAAISVGVTNPTSDTSRPVAISNDIYRSDPHNAEVRVATGVAVNGTWIDYTPANNVVYTYRAVARASSGGGTSS